MPKEVTDKLARTLNDIIAQPAVVARFAELGLTPLKLNGDDFAAYVGKQVKDWTPAIKAADLK